MKLDLTTLGMAVLTAALATACARPLPATAPAAEPTSTTQLTFAATEPASEPAPKVGKSQRALDAEEQDALEPKRVRQNEGSVRKSGGFGDWK
jgi:hypothetical protein